MPEVPDILRARHRREFQARRNPWGKLGLGCAILLSLFVSLVGLILGSFYIDLTRDLPSLDALPSLLEPPDGLLLQPTRIYDRSGEHLLFAFENPAAQNREYLTLDRSQPNYLPPALISATLATADPDFWVHPGFHLDNLQDDFHPTLAMQLVADFLLWNEPPGWRRAFRERLLAAQITAYYGRERLLTWYLNSVNYGRLAFGADAASRVYFGKPAAKLTLAEAATLAAIAQAPALNPHDTPSVSVERQRAVLQTMLAQGVINADQAIQAEGESLDFRPPAPAPNNPAPTFIRLILGQLASRYNLERLERGGYRLITSLDYDLQMQAGCTLATQIARLGGNLEEIRAADGSECQAARLLPTIPLQTNAELRGVRAGVMIYDPLQGQILALVGDEAALLADQPGGTALSPFLYLTAFTRGLSPATMVWDIPDESGIANFDQKYHGPVRLRMAMINDYLAPANQIIRQVGGENIQKTLQQFGFSPGEIAPQTSRDYFGQIGVSLIEICQAYGAFANQGVLVGERSGILNGTQEQEKLQAVAILNLQDYLGRPWQGQESQPQARLFTQRPVINPQLAYLVTNVLSDETARWSSLGHPNPLEIGRPAAAKIGQTLDGGSTWVVGYTPDILVGVHLNLENPPAQIPGFSRQAAGLWYAVMQYTQSNRPALNWSAPAGVSQVSVCDPSGLLPSKDCPTLVNEVFLTGTEPTQVDTLYRAVQVNRVTGRLATALTPPDLIEDRVYLIVPSEAEEWARQSGLPIPPDEYDVIQRSSSASTSQAQINSPAMFAIVGGRVVLEGRANSEDFAYYRLLAGKGLNPRAWVQIGEDITQPVEQGFLGEWDTQGLDGLYTIQLQVVQNDQQVEIALIQITVDNLSPRVSISSPLEGQESAPRAGQITLAADAQDNLEIRFVEFYLDGKLLERRYQAPYAIAWTSQPGEHTLRVVAVDKAGNQAEDSIKFRVRQ